MAGISDLKSQKAGPGLIEQIRRMDAVDWAKRAPFSPVAQIQAGEVAAAAVRLRDDRYEGAVEREKKGLGRMVEGIEGYEPPLLGPQTQGLTAALRERDRATITDFFLRRQRESEMGETFGGAVFQGLTYMPSWMIEFALTGGLAKLGSKTAEEIGMRTLRGYAATKGGQAALKAAGWTGGVISRTTLGMPHRLAEQILERRIPSIRVGPAGEFEIATPSESWATSLVKGYEEMLIQVGVESTGEGIVAGGKWISRKTVGRLPFASRLYDGMRQRFLAMHPEPGAAAAFANRFFDAAKFDGLVGEIGENHLQTILEGIAGTQNFTKEEDPGRLENLAAGFWRDMQLQNLAAEATVIGTFAAGRKAISAIGGEGGTANEPPGGPPVVSPVAAGEKSEIENQKSKIEGESDAVQGQGQGRTQGQVEAAGRIIQHYTLAENIPKILAEGFDTTKPPIHGTGSLAGGVRTGKSGSDVLYFTTDKGRWSTATVFVGEGKGDVSSPAYDYAKQQWVKEENAYKRVPLQAIDAAIQPDARILTIDNLQDAQRIAKDRFHFIDDLVEYARQNGYDVLNLKNPGGAAWESLTPNKYGELNRYEELTGGSGRDDYFIINRKAINLVNPGAVQGQTQGRTQGQVEAPAAAERGIFDQAVADAEAEAEQQARERYIGPDQWTFQDYAGALEGKSEQELRKMAGQLGARVPGATGETLRKWIGDAIANWTKTGSEPQPVIQGEPHPGSMGYKKFFERYGQALAAPESPEQAPWWQRYGPHGVEGVRGLYKRLQEDYRRGRAWELFYGLTGQERPTQEDLQSQISDLGEEGVDENWPRTEAEAREIEQEQAAMDTISALNEFMGRVPPADLPPAPPGDPEATPGPEPTPAEVSLWRKLLHRFGIRSIDGVNRISRKDLNRLIKVIQLPADRALTFPQYAPLRDLQVARQRGHASLVWAMMDQIKPYVTLSAADRKGVNDFLVANDQHPGDNAILGPMQAKLTPEQFTAWKSIRKAMDDAGELLIAHMRKLGVREEWIQEFMARLGNYIPHKWYKPWRIVVKQRLTPDEIKARGGKAPTLFMADASYAETFQVREELKERFPDADVSPAFKATKMPMEAFHDAPYAAVKQMMELVIEKANERTDGHPDLSPEQVEAMKRAWTDMWKEKGFGQHFMARQEVPGWTQDLKRPIVEYLTGLAGYLTKMEAAMAFPDALARIDMARTPELWKAAEEDIRFWMGNDEHWRRLKGLAYFWYLLGNVKTATTNLSGNLVMAWPVLSKYTRWPMLKLWRALEDTAGDLLDQKELDYLAKKEKEGSLAPKLMLEMKARAGNPLYDAIRTKGAKAISWFDFNSKVEGLNRRAAFIALLRAGIADPAAEPGKDPADKIVNEAHGEYGKANRVPLARGLASPTMTFRSWTWHYVTWMKNEIKAGRIAPEARSLVAMVLLGGGLGLPGVAILRNIYASVFKRDPEKDLGDLVGNTAAEILFHGAPSQLGISLTGSVGLQDLVPSKEPGQNWERVLLEWGTGVFGDVPARAARIGKDLQTGQYARALEDFAPEALRNPMVAARLYHEGATTRSGRVLWDFEGSEQMRLDEQEAALKALGFQPERMARDWDKKTILNLAGAGRQEAKEAWADRLYMAMRQGDDEAYKAAAGEIDVWNARWRRRNRPSQIVTPAEMKQMIKARGRPANAPTKNMARLYLEIWGKPEPAKKE